MTVAELIEKLREMPQDAVVLTVDEGGEEFYTEFMDAAAPVALPVTAWRYKSAQWNYGAVNPARLYLPGSAESYTVETRTVVIL